MAQDIFVASFPNNTNVYNDKKVQISIQFHHKQKIYFKTIFSVESK